MDGCSNLEKRFNAKVDRRGEDDCWPWTGTTDKDGYGVVYIGGKQRAKAHRIAWELHHGRSPGTLCVLHVCDRPQCVNPSHLFTGTQADNVADRVAKGRTGDRRGEANGNSKLTQDDIEQIRSLHGKFSRGELSEIFEVSHTHICQIIKNIYWTKPPTEKNVENE